MNPALSEEAARWWAEYVLDLAPGGYEWAVSREGKITITPKSFDPE